MEGYVAMKTILQIGLSGMLYAAIIRTLDQIYISKHITSKGKTS